MVVTRTADTPIVYTTSVVTYGAGVAPNYQEKSIVETSNAPITFQNNNGETIYTASGSGSTGQQAFTSN